MRSEPPSVAASPPQEVPSAPVGEGKASSPKPGRLHDAGASLALVLATLALSTAIDPYLTFGSPVMAQAINAAGPLLLALLFFAVTGRVLPSLALVAALLGLLAFADGAKQAVLHINLLYADFKVLPELLKQPELVVGFVKVTRGQLLGLTAACAGFAMLAVWSFSRPGSGTRARIASAALLVLGLGAVELYPAPTAVPSLGWLLPMQISGAPQVGVSGNILLGRMVARNVMPDVDQAMVAGFWADPSVAAAKARLLAARQGPRPDIIFIQSESLFEPSLLCGFPDEPFLATVAAQPGGSFENLQVPVYGSRTLQTEFEVLSGFPVDFAPKSQFSYYDLVDRPINALPRHLASEGYRTVALHPSRRSFWRRDYAMPAMGFESFVDGSGYFRNGDFTPDGWVSDSALVGTILSELDAARQPSMVFAISIANHGPWGTKPVTDQSGIRLPDALQGAARNELLDYLKRARAADRTYGGLLQALRARSRPTMVVFYGDHLPALEQTFAQLCFKDGKSPQKHMPPMRVWSNFPLQADSPDLIPSYLLAGWTLRAAGLSMNEQFLAAAIMAELQADSAVSAERKRGLLSMYGHVAAHATLVLRPEPGSDALANIAKGQAGSLLIQLQVPGEHPAVAEFVDGEVDIRLALGAGVPLETSFDLSGRLAGAVFRPYLSLANEACLTNAKAGTADFEVLADGRRILLERLHPNSVKLPYLDLSGVERLTLRTHAPAEAAGCGQVGLRVSQLFCYSADCQTAPSEDPGRMSAVAISPSPTSEPPVKDPLVSDLGRSHFILRHLLGFEAPYTPVKLTPDRRIFLHPTAEKPAWLEADVTGISSIEFVPRIEALDSACKANAQGGIVGLAISVDGVVAARQEVDRNTDGFVMLPMNGGSRLRIEVDAGNGVAWCDWFAIGFSKILRESPLVQPLTASIETSVAAASPTTTLR